jgi:hypothetical protein
MFCRAYPVELYLFHRRQMFRAGLHKDMTGRAGAVTPALVRQIKSVLQRGIQNSIAGTRFHAQAGR